MPPVCSGSWRNRSEPLLLSELLLSSMSRRPCMWRGCWHWTRLNYPIDKFPKTVKPAVWWPELDHSQLQRTRRTEGDGWSKELLGRGDEGYSWGAKEEYMRCDKLVLKINRILAVSGSLLAGLAAVGAGFIGIPALGPWPVLAGVVGGAALAATMNTLEHAWRAGWNGLRAFTQLRRLYLQLELRGH